MVTAASPALLLLGVALSGARLVLADDDNSGHTTAIIGFVVAIILLLMLSCGIQRRRARRAALSATSINAYRPQALPLTSHSLRYGNSASSQPFAAPTGSEYPPQGAADWAPPPYVKEEGTGGQQEYAPPPGPPPSSGAPPAIDAPYSYAPPPGPPPRAHIHSTSADFTNGFTNNVGGFRSASPPTSPPPRSPAAP
ncbi:hypothetical protein R3P38DRAFT_3433621 [Favolaschia claudopus]|uniref:Uncharacterized protein n=1 Tax=Favolaschia claudopus TaxID=2862362 RepID=A0AAW0D112_9AGAR